MRLLSTIEMSTVAGGNKQPPECTTEDGKTTCSCPAGTVMTVKTNELETVITCDPPYNPNK